MDYFAVSLPDLQIWDGGLQLANRIHCLYMIALGSLGLGNLSKASETLDEVLRLSPYHQGVMSTKSLINCLVPESTDA